LTLGGDFNFIQDNREIVVTNGDSAFFIGDGVLFVCANAIPTGENVFVVCAGGVNAVDSIVKNCDIAIKNRDGGV